MKKTRTKRKTNQQFIKEVYDLVGDEYTSLEEYNGAHKHIKMRHNTCGHIWNISPANFTNNGRRCPNCANKKRGKQKRKTTEEFKKEIFNLVGNEYDLLSEYIKNDTEVIIKHNVCNKEYSVFPRNFTSGRRCPNCFGTHKKTNSQYKEEIYNLVGDEYVVLGSYTNAQIPILMKHVTCGFEWGISPNNFLTGRRCPKCQGIVKNKDTDYFKQEVFELEDSKYTVLGEYKGAHHHLLIRHNECNLEYEVTPDNFLSGRRCPSCTILSKGEIKIRETLKSNFVSFKEQKWFDECRNDRVLPFDFAIYDTNNDLVFLIEYDGQHHYKPIEYFGGMEYFQKVQHNDQIKDQYCIENNIHLIRIPYWEFDNIETILEDKVLNKLHRKLVVS